ncbi:MAG: AraC family transcriptional regulator [Fibrobacterota bacterium]
MVAIVKALPEIHWRRSSIIIVQSVFLALLFFRNLAFSGVLWSEDFEYGRTFLDVPVKPGDTVLCLMSTRSLVDWPDSAGMGVLDPDNPAQREYFTYRKCHGGRLSGVQGLTRGHPKGTETGTCGIRRWSDPTPPEIDSEQNKVFLAIHDGFGVALIPNGPGLEHNFPERRSLHLRFYLRLDTLFPIKPATRQHATLHTLEPNFPVEIKIRPDSASRPRLEFFVFFKTVYARTIAIGETLCIEYECRADTVDKSRFFRLWINGASCVSIVQPKEDRWPVFFSLQFGNQLYPRPTPEMEARVRIDDIVLSEDPIGPQSPPPAIRFEVADSEQGTLSATPETGDDVEAWYLQGTAGNDWAFPVLSRKIAIPSNLAFRLSPILPLQALSFRSKIKRKGQDWGLWSLPAPLPQPLLQWYAKKWSERDTRRPCIDSLAMTREGKAERTGTLITNQWYDLYCYARDPSGYGNLWYNLLVMRDTEHPDADLLNRGGVFDPKGSYFISLAGGGKERRVFIRQKEGVDYIEEHCERCSLLVKGGPTAFVENKATGYWKTTFRLLPQATPGAWQVEGQIYNKQDVPSVPFRKRFMVVAETPRLQRAFLPLAIGLALCLALAFTVVWILRKRKGRETAGVEKIIKDNRIADAVQFILANYTKDISVGHVANAIDVNPSWLGSAFKKQIGQSMVSYITALKCNKAKALLEDFRLNVSEVGYKVGFNHPEYFNNVFKKLTGMSPNQYRKSKIKEPSKNPS